TAQGKERSLMPQQSWTKAIGSRISQIYSVRFLPNGFAQMLYVTGGLKRSNYSFEYVRREFLGEVRCIVFDVKPIPNTDGTFAGRIWIEDQDYNIVRFNGSYGPSTP